MAPPFEVLFVHFEDTTALLKFQCLFPHNSPVLPAIVRLKQTAHYCPIIDQKICPGAKGNNLPTGKAVQGGYKHVINAYNALI